MTPNELIANLYVSHQNSGLAKELLPAIEQYVREKAEDYLKIYDDWAETVLFIDAIIYAEVLYRYDQEHAQ